MHLYGVLGRVEISPKFLCPPMREIIVFTLRKSTLVGLLPAFDILYHPLVNVV